MGLKICKECGEEVDKAKAFCPDCGNPFVEEETRETSSEFDDYAGTMNFSTSVYKMMLSEMELDTSQEPNKEKQINTPKALNEDKISEVQSPKNSSKQIDLQEERPTTQDRKQSKKKNNWIIFAAIGGVVLLVLLLLGLMVILYFIKN